MLVSVFPGEAVRALDSDRLGLEYQLCHMHTTYSSVCVCICVSLVIFLRLSFSRYKWADTYLSHKIIVVNKQLIICEKHLTQ